MYPLEPDSASELNVAPPFTLSRRSAIKLLVGAGVLPTLGPILYQETAAADPSPPGGPGGQSSTSGQLPLSEPLRTLPKPGLVIEPIATITGRSHRLAFSRATWEGGHGFVRDLFTKVNGAWVEVTDPAQRFDEQWLVLTGESGNPSDYYQSMSPAWVTFDELRKLNRSTVELKSRPPGGTELTVRWSVQRGFPEAQYTVTAVRDEDVVVGYQAFEALPDDEALEVLCGSRQHARVIEGANALGAWELFAPMSLVERELSGRNVTRGVFIPADVLEFEHERETGPDGQAFGMSLRNNDRRVQPVVFAPQVGRRSTMAAGETRGYAFGVYAAVGDLSSGFRALAEQEYRYTNYRENIFGTSLTDTVHNMIELIMVEPDGDDSVEFVPSYSGWWNRAKGFVDLENERAVRTTVASALLSAYYLTGHDGLYERRARPLLEYHVSRWGHGSTPIIGNPVYGNRNLYRVGQVSGEASTLVPLYQMTRRQNAGLHDLAMEMLRQRPNKETKTTLSNPLQGFLLTGDEAFLAEIRAEARRLIRDEIDAPYTTNQPESGFGYWYVKAWLELLVAYELTGDEDILAGAHREALRYITQMQVRPVPKVDVVVPNQPFIDAPTTFWEEHELFPDYAVTTVDSEKVPAWMVSTTGATFEQLTTFKVAAGRVNPGGGFTWIPGWAGFLLRVGMHTGDSLITATAHNLVVGRYTNYPGYYNRQFITTHMKPRFPYEGPHGISNIYFHHAPAQLALTIDYLISEHVARTGGRISFPREFEINYVFFRYYVYGHAPGTFHGEDGVWPYLPKGLVTLDNHQINWIGGVGNDSLYLSLTNESDGLEVVTVDFATEVSGIGRHQRLSVERVAADGKRSTTTLQRGRATVPIPAKGAVALVVRGVQIATPWQWEPDGTDRSGASHHTADLEPSSSYGLVRGMLLVRPDRKGYDAYIQVDTEQLAIIEYRVDEGEWIRDESKVFPYEWTVGVEALTSEFTYRVSYGSLTSDPVTLRLPSSITGVVPAGVLAVGELSCREVTTAGDVVRVGATVRTEAGVSSADVMLHLPDGWTAVAVGDVPNAIPEQATARWHWDVTIPADAAASVYSLSVNLVAGEQTIALEGTTIELLTPTIPTAIRADNTALANPGDSVTLTLAVLNRGPVDRTGPIDWRAPVGWELTGDTTYDIPARSEREFSVTLTTPVAIPRGSRHRIGAWVGGAEKALIVGLAELGVVVDDSHGWPTYSETGAWMPSGLRGWSSTTSRYSPEGVAGGTVTWRPELPTAGTYDVSVWYPSNHQTATRALYSVHHRDGTQEIEVNQQVDANGWRLLGRFDFDEGTAGFVRLTVAHPESGYHRVDAAQFMPVDPSLTGPVVEGLTVGSVAGPGTATTLTGSVKAPPNEALQANVQVHTPAGWTVSPASVTIDLAQGEAVAISFALTSPPTASSGDLHELVLAVGDSRTSTSVAIGQPDPQKAVIVDTDEAGYSELGPWTSSGLPGRDGGPTRFTSGNTSAVATWRPELPEPGRYLVSAWYPSHENCTTSATYSIITDTSPMMVSVNQREGGSQWRELAIVSLTPESAAVQLASYSAGTHRSDEMRFDRLVQAVEP